ncbi:MAG TPA: hypothetical protein PLA50_06485 [Bacteroidia bacterium]|nr:hypothetical protein [Bacteroidia bacterium]
MMLPAPKRSQWSRLGIAGCLLLAWAFASADGVEETELIPAAFGIWTDRSGSSWSVEADGNIGRIGSAMVNSGLALTINDAKFTAHQPMMTSDGKEFVLQGQPLEALPGLRMQRRVRLLEERGGLRYAELFHNGSADPMRFTVALATNFSGNFKTFLSDRGRAEPTMLSPSEDGLVVLPGASQSSRAFLFTLAGGERGIKPTLSSQNRYGLVFRYGLVLAPGETAVIAHHVAQVVIPQSFDRRALVQLGQPYSLAAIRDTFDEDWLPFVVNDLDLPEETEAMRFESEGVASLGLRAGDLDLLAVGESTRLAGRVEGGPIRLATAYGTAEFPLEKIAAISGGGRQPDGKCRVFLRDGQILSGEAEVGDLGFTPTEGKRIPLDPAKLDRLVFGEKSPGTGWPSGTLALLETWEGDRIRVAPGETVPFRLATRWGMLSFRFEDLLALAPVDAGQPGSRAELLDGTVCEGFLDGGEIALAGTALGDMKLPVSRLKRVYTEAGWRQRDGESVAAAPFVRLADRQTVVGGFGAGSVSILSEGGKLEMPLSEIRRIVRTTRKGMETPTEKSAQFRLERWDGGVVVGALLDTHLPLTVGDETWRIAAEDIAEAELASPDLDAETLARIDRLVRDLASPEWSIRESATRELVAFGYLVRPVVQRELAKAADPEVERRLQRVLDRAN